MITKITNTVYIDTESVIALKKTTLCCMGYGLEIHMKNGNKIVLENLYTTEEIDKIIDKILGDNNNELK